MILQKIEKVFCKRLFPLRQAYTEERDSESDWEEDSEEEMDYTDDTDSTMTTHLYQQG